jgi:hypothetical protein
VPSKTTNAKNLLTIEATLISLARTNTDLESRVKSLKSELEKTRDEGHESVSKSLSETFESSDISCNEGGRCE